MKRETKNLLTMAAAGALLLAAKVSHAVPITGVDGTPLPNTWEFTNELNGWLGTS